MNPFKAVRITSINRAAVSVALFYLALPFAARAEDQPASVPASKNETIVLDKMTVKAGRERLEVYQAKADDIFDGLRAAKRIRYATVILSSYDTSKFDLVETLVAKKTYRETVARGHTFFCNYAAINMDVPVYFEMYDETRGIQQASGGLGGSMYLFKKKKIQVRIGGDKTKIYHAAGAALSGFIAPEYKNVIQEIGKKKKDAEFVKQVNFEIRLQDLNRFHALLTMGYPIKTPVDAVRAIVSLGERLKKPMVEQILARNRINYEPEALEKALASPKFNDGGEDNSEDGSGVSPTTFTVAKRLVAGFWGAEGGFGGSRVPIEPGLETLSGKAYEDYLERILIEAPGHI